MTSSEITSAVQEFWQRITETWLDAHDDRDRQTHFWEVFMRWPLNPNFHSARHPESLVGGTWLRTLDEMDSSSSVSDRLSLKELEGPKNGPFSRGLLRLAVLGMRALTSFHGILDTVSFVLQSHWLRTHSSATVFERHAVSPSFFPLPDPWDSKHRRARLRHNRIRSRKW